MTGTFSVPLGSDCLLSGGKGIHIVLVTTASSLTSIFMDCFFYLSPPHRVHRGASGSLCCMQRHKEG